MSIRVLIGDVRDMLATLPDESVQCVVTSPPYWGLRDYGEPGQLGLEPTLGEHLETMVSVFRDVRRVLRKDGTVWLNYGDCYATAPNGRSAADTKAAGNDDRTFRDKPFSTVGPVYAEARPSTSKRGANSGSKQNGAPPAGRVMAGGTLKPKDLCMVPNRLAIALQDDGWWVRSEIVWGKPNGMPDSSGKYRPSTAHEKIWLLSKSANSYYDAEAVRQRLTESSVQRLSQDIENQKGSERANGGAKTNGPMKAVGGKTDKKRGHSRRHAGFNDRWDAMTKEEQQANGRFLRNYEPAPLAVWHMAVAGFSEAHFATFPPELAARCIKAGTKEGDMVLDPFGGAGTTGLVADRLRRNCILIELNPEYAAMAEKRIRGDAPLLAEVAAE